MGGEAGNYSWAKREMKTSPEYSAAWTSSLLPHSHPHPTHLLPAPHHLLHPWRWQACLGNGAAAGGWAPPCRSPRMLPEFLQQVLWELVLTTALSPLRPLTSVWGSPNSAPPSVNTRDWINGSSTDTPNAGGQRDAKLFFPETSSTLRKSFSVHIAGPKTGSPGRLNILK